MLAGAVIAIWNGIRPGARAEFTAWHDTEHIPERVGIQGFLRGRRYVAADPTTTPEFFTLYEVEDFSVIQGEHYRDRLNHPTAWTRTVTAEFRDTERALARVVVSLGPRVGGTLLTLRFAVQSAAIEPLRGAVREAARAPGVTGAHFCVTDAEASGVRSAESAGRDDVTDPPGGFVLIEGINAECLAPLGNLFAPHLDDASRRTVRRGFYRLEYLRAKAVA